jgi:hypothetical protein
VRGRLPSTPANVDLPTSNRSWLDEIRIPGRSHRKIPTTRCGPTDAVVSGSPHAQFSEPNWKAEVARRQFIGRRPSSGVRIVNGACGYEACCPTAGR